MTDLAKVSEDQMRAVIAKWPRPLEVDVFRAFEPFLVTYNDFTLGRWPNSVVASHRDTVPATHCQARLPEDPSQESSPCSAS